MKQLEVHIMQQSYMLGCPEGQEARLMAAVKHVDGAMSGIRDAGKIRGRERIAVLAALNVAFDLLDLQVQNSALSETADALQAQAAAQTAAMADVQAAPGPQASLDWDEPRLQSVMQRLDAALAPSPAQSPDASASTP
ncbi:cell division protein ZapA [Comamonas piscis]|uniref:Cell division protein ZapA n=1 Tax=Comamonas piscis TaxID=1562974 RepID=A0A7G5EL31_9BURK|nr:cell division protein ZapA [Comamonas piscis]QMV74706.1 cell division protein ZapA [Comamonas piscis]WSO33171.1 cell division protein ZapA [Comamonas piscis]